MRKFFSKPVWKECSRRRVQWWIFVRKNIKKQILEEQMKEDGHVSNNEVNQDISTYEIEFSMSKLNEKKAVCIDLLPMYWSVDHWTSCYIQYSVYILI